MKIMKTIIFVVITLFMASKGISQIDSTDYKNPKVAVTLAALCPGAGQIYNGKWLKAALIMGIDGYWIYEAVHFDKLHEEDPSKQYYKDSRNKYIWYSFGGYIYGVVDALVDAHLSLFPKSDIVFYGDKKNYNLLLTIRF